LVHVGKAFGFNIFYSREKELRVARKDPLQKAYGGDTLAINVLDRDDR
jgi:hypothetical protein